MRTVNWDRSSFSMPFNEGGLMFLKDGAGATVVREGPASALVELDMFELKARPSGLRALR